MPSPNRLTRPSPAPSHQRAPETDPEARARHLDMLREMAELAMRAARIATDRLEANDADPDAPDPSLSFARATHAVRQAIALEQRIRTGPANATAAAPARPAPPRDPRRPVIRDALRKAAQAEPDRATRAQICRFIDERLDVELDRDPDGDISIGELLLAIGQELDLTIDVSQLADHLLGLAPATIPQPDLSQPDLSPRDLPPPDLPPPDPP